MSPSLRSRWVVPPRALMQGNQARTRLSLLGEAAPLGAACPRCKGQGMLGALPQGGKRDSQFLWGSKQAPALSPPSPRCQECSEPTQTHIWDPPKTCRMQKPLQPSVPPKPSWAPPPQDYGRTGAAPKANQPLANFPSRPAYPAPGCRTELSRFSRARRGRPGGTRTAQDGCSWVLREQAKGLGDRPHALHPRHAAGTMQPVSPSARHTALADTGQLHAQLRFGQQRQGCTFRLSPSLIPAGPPAAGSTECRQRAG